MHSGIQRSRYLRRMKKYGQFDIQYFAHLMGCDLCPAYCSVYKTKIKDACNILLGLEEPLSPHVVVASTHAKCKSFAQVSKRFKHNVIKDNKNALLREYIVPVINTYAVGV